MELSIILTIVFGTISFVVGLLVHPFVMPLLHKAHRFVFPLSHQDGNLVAPLVRAPPPDPLPTIQAILDELRTTNQHMVKMQDLLMMNSRSGDEWVGEMRLRRSGRSAQNPAPHAPEESGRASARPRSAC
ncbi:hypothetical protein F5B18DRAFT_629728 [Nemania serpens]|nr:hypothetical protein F5B18DRAFT_629728 [Nemania serpens]